MYYDEDGPDSWDEYDGDDLVQDDCPDFIEPNGDDDQGDRIDFADPGGRSALRAATLDG